MWIRRWICLCCMVLAFTCLSGTAQNTADQSPGMSHLPDARDEHYLLMLARQKAQIDSLQNEIQRLKQQLSNKGGVAALSDASVPDLPDAASVNKTDDGAASLAEQLRRAQQEVIKTKVTMHYNLGRVYHKMKKPLEAEKYYLYALSLAPRTPDIHYNLGVLYDDYLHDDKKARKHYEEFLHLKPKGPDAAMVTQWLAELE